MARHRTSSDAGYHRKTKRLFGHLSFQCIGQVGECKRPASVEWNLLAAPALSHGFVPGIVRLGDMDARVCAEAKILFWCQYQLTGAASVRIERLQGALHGALVIWQAYGLDCSGRFDSVMVACSADVPIVNIVQ
jgi:hypothetical protein